MIVARVALVTVTLAALNARAAPKTNLQHEPAIDERFQAYTEPIAGVDWDQLSPHFVQMIDRIFERNGWTAEPDQFARKVATRVAQLPPWDLPGRLGVLSEEVATRYGLTPQQSAMFQRAVMRESFALLVKHGPELWDQAKEALQGRAAGQPYTAEQIARWTKMSEPLYGEIEAGVQKIAGELEKVMPEEKRGVLANDMAAFQKRQKVVEEMSRRWANGQWRPEEWGLEDDPVQVAAARAAAQQQAMPDAPPPPRPAAKTVQMVAAAPQVPIPSHWIEHDPATWIALVVEAGKKYQLDTAQMDTAWSIHAELVERARRYADARKAELTAVPENQRATSEAYLPIRELFAELRDRLDSIPTSMQRAEKMK